MAHANLNISDFIILWGERARDFDPHGSLIVYLTYDVIESSTDIPNLTTGSNYGFRNNIYECKMFGF